MANGSDYTQLLRICAGYDYVVRVDYVWVIDEGGAIEYNVGRVEDIVRWNKPREKFVETIKYMRIKRKQEKEEEKRMSVNQLKEEAKENGQFWGEFIVALNPRVPRDMLWEVGIRGAKLSGYTDMDTGNAFLFALMNVVENYNKANTVQLLKGATDATQS